MSNCRRYNSLYTDLEEAEGILSWEEGVDALEAVHMNCPWSDVYDMTTPGAYIAIMNNYTDNTFLDLESFNPQINVGYSENFQKSGKFQLEIATNPFTNSTGIRFYLPSKMQVNLSATDQNGKRIRTLLNEFRNWGSHVVVWDGRDDNGSTLPPGIYIITMHCETGSQSTRLILLED